MSTDEYKYLRDKLLVCELEQIPEFTSRYNLTVSWVAEHLDLYRFWYMHSYSLVPDVPNWDEHFSARTANALVANGVLNPNEIWLYSIGELQEMRGIGKKALHEIRQFIKRTKDPFEEINHRYEKMYEEPQEY